MHLSRRSVSVLAIALTFVGVSASAVVRGEAFPAIAPNPVVSGFEPRSVVFTGSDRGAVAGTIVCRSCTRRRTAAIASTADGGATWSSPITFGSRVATDLVAARGTDEMWASVGRRLAHSSDGGTTWSLLPRSSVVYPSFATADEGWGIRPRWNREPAVMETSDGGTSWQRGPNPCRPGARSPIRVDRVTADHGWVVCGGQGAAGSLVQVVWETTDGGATWTRRSHRLAPTPIGYQFLDDGRGWRWLANSPDLYRTTDGGSTWSDLGPVAGREMLSADVWFVSDAEGFALAQRPNEASMLVGTTDGGDTWAKIVAFPAS